MLPIMLGIIFQSRCEKYLLLVFVCFINKKFNIYEYLDKEGQPEQYVCSGHVDSTEFRDKCQEMYAVKPMVVQHRWRRIKRVVKHDSGKKKDHEEYDRTAGQMVVFRMYM